MSLICLTCISAKLNSQWDQQYHFSTLFHVCFENYTAVGFSQSINKQWVKKDQNSLIIVLEQFACQLFDVSF